MRIGELIRDVGQPVAFYPRLAIVLGGVKEAVFVSQLLYWEGKQADPDRWIHKSLSQITDETGLSRYEQEGLRRNLEQKGILESHYDRLIHRLYFRIDLSRLSECWEKAYPWSKAGAQPPSPSESGKSTFGKTEEKKADGALAKVEKRMRKSSIGECGKTTFV